MSAGRDGLWATLMFALFHNSIGTSVMALDVSWVQREWETVGEIDIRGSSAIV